MANNQESLNIEKISPRQFMKYLILKYSEIKDYLQLISWKNWVALIIQKIFQENQDDEETLAMKVLNDSQSADIDFHMESQTPTLRVKNFMFLLKNILKDSFESNSDEYYENRKIIEDAFTEYQNSFSIKTTDNDIFNDMVNNNQVINLSEFWVFFDNRITKAWQSAALAARYWVGKTVFSVNYIKDVVKSNNDVCVLYFGTSEVNKENFLRRMMMMLSNEPIWELFDTLSKDEDKIKELESILAIFDMDKSQSLKYLQNALHYNKYYSLFDDDQSLDNRIEVLYKEIEKLNQDTWQAPNSPKIKQIINSKKSEIASLELKKNDNIKMLVSYLLADEGVLKIVKNIYDILSKNEEYLKETKEDGLIELDDSDFAQTLTFFQEKGKKHNISYLKEIFRIPFIVTNITRINDFLGFLINKWNKFYSNEIKNSIKVNYEEMINDFENIIKQKKQILRTEYDKVLTFMAKEHVEIEDNLNINFIEKKIKRCREKFPNHKLTFIIDYQQKLEWVPAEDRASKSEAIWKIVSDWTTKYQAFGILLSQLNDFSKDIKGQIKYSTRPSQSNLRDGEWLAQWVWGLGMIFNRDFFPYPEDADIDISSIDMSFVIYEIYLTKNRYGNHWYHQSRQYFIFDKKKMSYLAVSRKWYQMLDKNKEILYLDQLIALIKSQTWNEISLSDIVA